MIQAKKGSKAYEYGTAGFRTKASEMPAIAYSMGILVHLLGRKRKAPVGVMITASHNPEEDNGIKVIEPTGEMLEVEWEGYCDEIVNCELKGKSVDETVAGIVERERIQLVSDENVTVLIGMDTRESGPSIKEALISGLRLLDRKRVTIIDYGCVTTPQLHWFVGRIQSGIFPNDETYFENFTAALSAITKASRLSQRLFVDASNGVGAMPLRKFVPVLREKFGLEIFLFNDGSAKGDVLNFECGADFVKTRRSPPKGTPMSGDRFCSIDGDADRLVYFYFDEKGSFRLLDGDKIAALLTLFLRQLFQAAGLASFTLGVVQTAYANGGSSRFFQNSLRIDPKFVCTGVKNLHPEAKKFDAGVYFEANGHGTVVFGERLREKVQHKKQTASSSERSALLKLEAFIALSNEFVGDAISDLLLCEVALKELSLSLPEWDSLYSELPSVNAKVAVPDKRLFKTFDADRRLAAPPELQVFIDGQVEKFSLGRCFVRASGTEDMLRIYTEAETQEMATILSDSVVDCIVSRYGGRSL